MTVLKTVMDSLVRHLHDFAREVQLTEAEWSVGIDFLTRVGKIMATRRKEVFLATKFCREYPINQDDTAAGKPGVLIGRYPGDTYAGGNPWQLLTAVTAEVFYLGGTDTLGKIRQRGGQDYVLDFEENKEWLSLLNVSCGKE